MVGRLERAAWMGALFVVAAGVAWAATPSTPVTTANVPLFDTAGHAGYVQGTVSVDAITGQVTVIGTGTLAVQPTVYPVGITPTDRTITSATGSSQTLMNAAARRTLVIINTGNANCGVNPTGGTAAIAGAGTLTLVPYGVYAPTIPTQSAVTVICTSGQPIYAAEG